MKGWFAAGFVVIALLAAAFRLPDLTLRPLHNDEGDNAIKFRGLWNENDYKYDPTEFHGPTLPYFTLPAAWLNGSRHFNDFSEATFRRVTAVFGIGTVLLLLLLTPELGKTEALWGALFAAVSPALVYYSRDYIHETLLLFFTVLAAGAWWRFCQSKHWGWCVLAGIGLGLMAATKETFICAVAAFVVAAAFVPGFGSWQVNKKGIALTGGIAALIGIVFFSSFFSNWPGVLGAIETYVPWLHRAGGGSPHVHPWYFYFQRLFFYHANGGPFWSEGLIGILAIVGSCVAFRSAATLARFVAFYTLCLTLIYTALPYKTPWCLIQFYYGMIVLAGVGAGALVRTVASLPFKGAIAAGILALTGQLGWQAWMQNFGFDRGGIPYCDTDKNPYVYSQTSADIYRLLETVEAVAGAAKSGLDTPIEVMSPNSYWPLPWYLRRFRKVGYFDSIPDQPLAPIMIVSAELHADFDDRPGKTHLMAGYFQLRPNVFYELYVSANLWKEYLKKASPEKN